MERRNEKCHPDGFSQLSTLSSQQELEAIVGEADIRWQ